MKMGESISLTGISETCFVTEREKAESEGEIGMDRFCAVRFKSLRSVFPEDDLHVQIARMLMLYEDLKIEVYQIDTMRFPAGPG